MIDAGATPRSDIVAEELVFQLPAHRGFVGQIGSALEATLNLVDRHLSPDSDLETALRTVAAAIITHARPWSPLEISIAVDDTDAFVRLSAELLDPDAPALLGEHVQAMLRRDVESHEVLHQHGTVAAVLQVPLEPVG